MWEMIPHPTQSRRQRQLVELAMKTGGFRRTRYLGGRTRASQKYSTRARSYQTQASTVFDSRFGIQIPYRGPPFEGVEELTLDPPHIGSCQVSIRGPALAPSAIFAAEAFIGPPYERDWRPGTLLRNSDFAITLQSPRVEFSTLGDFNTATRPLQRWIDLTRALVLFSERPRVYHDFRIRPILRDFTARGPADGRPCIAISFLSCNSS